MKWRAWFIFVPALLTATPALAWPATTPRNFVYLGQDELEQNLAIFDRTDIAGAQIMYVWLSLEPQKGRYDFSMIEHDLALANARGKAV